MRRLRLQLSGLVNQPLLLAQAAASLSGALVMFLAAAQMEPVDFVVFSLVNLISTTTVGAVRAGLLQPALIQQRLDEHARTRFSHALAAALAASLIGTVVTVAVHWLTPGELALLFLSGIFPILHDWVRFRAMSLDRRWAVAAADGLRLLLVAILSPLTLLVTKDPIIFQAVQAAALAIPALVVFTRLPRVGQITALARYRSAALLQLTDFGVGQFITTVPLIVLGGLAASGTIAGVRFAQTLLGPLNLVFSASTANLMTDAASDDSLRHDHAMVTRGSRLARRLGVFSVVLIAALIAVVWLTGVDLRGVHNHDLVAGLALVGLATCSAGWAGIHAILLRLLGRQGLATAGRAVLTVTALVGYLVGYLLGGVDLALVLGFLASAVVNPLVFVIPAGFVYRRLDPAGRSSATPAAG